ncbi:MAG: flagellar export chaperone FliS [Phycisphaerales bacterium]
MTSQNAYLRTRVMTASPAELRLMLFDGAIRFLTQGIEGLEAGQHEQAYDGYSQCQAIVVELINALDPKHAPELCDTLSSLYTFMYTQLVESLTSREPSIGREVLELLEYERDTWRMVMEALANEGAESADVVMATRTAAAGNAGTTQVPGVDAAGAIAPPRTPRTPSTPGRNAGGIPSPYGNVEPRHAGPVTPIDPRGIGGHPGQGGPGSTGRTRPSGGGSLSVKG